MKNVEEDLTLMLIDSDRYVRESIKEFFGEGCVDVLVFSTAAQGLNALGHQAADVVIADYFLPDMDGIECLGRARALHPKIISILMATMPCDDLELNLQRAGINRFIEKPLTVASLDTVIRELVRNNFSHQGRRLK